MRTEVPKFVPEKGENVVERPGRLHDRLELIKDEKTGYMSNMRNFNQLKVLHVLNNATLINPNIDASER
jgi:hypothetical protein